MHGHRLIHLMRRRVESHGEQGIALVLAVLILAMVTIVGASVIGFTTVNQQDAASKKSGVTAYSLAQAALSNATAQLTTHYYDSTGQPFDNTTSLATQASSWAPSSQTGGQQSPTSTAQCTTTSTCMTWSGSLTIVTDGIQRGLWHLTGTGKVPNPSGPGLLSRTITVDVPVTAPPAKTGAPDIFKTVYSGKPPSSTCDMTMQQGVIFKSPVYVLGNLCLNQSSGVDTPGTLVVGGWLDTGGQKGHVGSASSPVSSLSVGGSCDGTDSPSATCGTTLTEPAGKNYYTDGASIYTSSFSSSPVIPSPPAVDWSTLQTDRGSWTCTGGRSLDAASFDLTGSSYSCTTESGSLSWDGTNLTVDGNVYISGNLTSSGVNILYHGLGGIYVYGNVQFPNNTAICVDGVLNPTDCANGATWTDLEDNFLLILSHGPFAVATAKNFAFQGGIYSDQNITLGTGQTRVYGPMVTPQSIDPGEQAASGFPDIFDLFTGAPGTPQPFWQLGDPQNGTY